MLNGNTALASLLAESSSGKVIHSLEIEGVTSGATTAPQTVYDLTLNNVLVSSVQQSAAEGGSPARPHRSNSARSASPPPASVPTVRWARSNGSAGT